MLVYLLILVVHYIGDFLLQERAVAERKSEDNIALIIHVSIYSACFMFFWAYVIFPMSLFILACAITFTSHFVIDYYTSRWCKKFYLANKRGAFFKVLGLDQLVHYAVLFITYALLG